MVFMRTALQLVGLGVKMKSNLLEPELLGAVSLDAHPNTNSA
jgi:hypothetical protein